MTPQKLKQTEIGTIPEDWEVFKFSEEIIDLKNGLNFKKEQKGNTGILTIDVLNMYGHGIEINFNKLYRVNITLELNSDYMLKEGDILFVRSSLKKEGSAWTSLFKGYSEPVSFCGFIIRARLKTKKILPEFLTYYLRTNFSRNKLISSSGQVTISNISQDTLRTFYFPIPPIHEQQRIIQILSTLEAAINNVERERQVLERLKEGIMRELFAGKDWRIVKLSEIAEILDNKRIPLSEMERAKRRGVYPYCGANGVIDYIDGYLFDGEHILIAEDGGDYSKFGKSAYIMNGKFWVNNHAHVLKAIEGRTTNLFLFYTLNFMDLNVYIVGSTRTKLNQERLREIQIPLPSIEEQNRITEILSTLDKKLLSQQNKKSKLEIIKKGLMNELLTGKKVLR